LTFIPHGKGVVKKPDNTSYDGDWEDGKMHGLGLFRWYSNDGEIA